MAKGNMLLGYARGKVGDVVFKRVGGQQVTTPRNRQPRNPRSEAQTIQRLAFSSAVKTAKQLDGIVNHSFQGIEYGARSKNHFVSKAASVIAGSIYAALDGSMSAAPYRTAPAVPYDTLNGGAAAPVMVSSGDLASPLYEVTADGYLLGKLGGSVPQAGISVAAYEAFFGVPVTDQLTFVGARSVEVPGSSEVIFYASEFGVVRLNWKRDLPSDTLLFTQSSGTSLLLNTAAVDAERSSKVFTELTGDLTLLGSQIEITPELFGYDWGGLSCGCVIASRYDEGAWRRSTEFLSVIAPQVSTQAAWQLGTSWNPVDELLQYSVPGDTAHEEWYLNKKKV